MIQSKPKWTEQINIDSKQQHKVLASQQAKAYHLKTRNNGLKSLAPIVSSHESEEQSLALSKWIITKDNSILKSKRRGHLLNKQPSTGP